MVCGIKSGSARIPFICFDLAGGANLNGSEILIGGKGGQLDFLSTAGYAKLGLPGDMVPNATNAASPTGNFINRAFGVAWHSDGAILRGMLERTSPTTQAFTNGCAIAARSENDTGNNPHNPMYGILKTGSTGELLGLVGSQATDSGGNSMAPAAMIDLSNRPTKVDRASDVTGLVDTGDLASLLIRLMRAKVLESMARISGGADDPVSKGRLGHLTFGAAGGRDPAIQNAARCAYVRSAYLAEKFGNSPLNPDEDADIVDQAAARGNGIFGQAEYQNDAEFRKTAAVMKMVIDGNAGAGTITMGGYDYHDGTRASGELRNLRAGRCIGACLEYAARRGQQLDDLCVQRRLAERHEHGRQLRQRSRQVRLAGRQPVRGGFVLPRLQPGRSSGAGRCRMPREATASRSAITARMARSRPSSHPGANAVNLLVETVVLNYMALHGEQFNLFHEPRRSISATAGTIGEGLRDARQLSSRSNRCKLEARPGDARICLVALSRRSAQFFESRCVKLRPRSLTLLSSLCEGCPRQRSQALAKDFSWVGHIRGAQTCRA